MKPNWANNSSPTPLDIDVAIIGAGPGGLAAAHALQKIGLSVKVFERAKELRPLGAALGLFPNAYKALEAIDPDLSLQVLNVGVELSEQILQKSTGEIVFQGLSPFSELKTKYGQPFQWIGWFRLQNVLQETLSSNIISLGYKFIGFTEKDDSVIVHFEGQQSVKARLIVGADGINSIVRNVLLNDGKPRYMGSMSWRSVVENIDGISSPGLYRHITGDGKNFAIIDVGGGYTCWTGTALSESDSLSATPAEAKSRVLNEFREWPEIVEKVVQATDESRIIERGICDRLPVESWSQARVTLLGDAAHPMRPSLGQGTCMAFEDAYELSVCLAEAQNLQAALTKYETQRIPRTQILQERAVAEGVRAYKDGRINQLLEAAKNWTASEFDDWLYQRQYKQLALYTVT